MIDTDAAYSYRLPSSVLGNTEDEARYMEARNRKSAVDWTRKGIKSRKYFLRGVYGQDILPFFAVIAFAASTSSSRRRSQAECVFMPSSHDRTCGPQTVCSAGLRTKRAQKWARVIEQRMNGPR